EDQDVLDQKIGDIIEEVRPTLVFTFYPGYSVHPDHDATGEAVVRTIRRLPKDKRPVVRCVAFAKNTEADLGKPDITVDVKPYLEKKMASIGAHRSQFQVAEMVGGGKKLNDPAILERFGTERFWTYVFR